MAQGLSTVQTRPWQPGERPPLEQPDDAGRIISWLCRCFPGKASSRAILSFDRYCGASLSSISAINSHLFRIHHLHYEIRMTSAGLTGHMPPVLSIPAAPSGIDHDQWYIFAGRLAAIYRLDQPCIGRLLDSLCAMAAAEPDEDHMEAHIAHLDFHLAAYPHLHQRAIALVGLVLADDQPSPPQTRAQNPSARHLDALDAYRSAPQLLGIVNAMTDRPGAITAPARRPHATDGAVAHFDSIDTDLDRLGMINAVRQLDTCDRLVKGQLWPQVAALHRPDASDALGRLLAVILPLVKFSEDAGDDPADKVEQLLKLQPAARDAHRGLAPGTSALRLARALLSVLEQLEGVNNLLPGFFRTSANPAKPQQKRSVATAPALLSHAKIRQASEVAKYIDRDADWLAQRYADFHGSHLRLSFRPNGLPYDLSRLAHYLSGPIASDLPPTLATHLAASAFNLMAAVMPPLLQAAVLHRLFPDACNVACDAATEAPDREWSDGRERFVPHPLMAVRLYAEACGYRIADLLGTAASVKKSMMPAGRPDGVQPRRMFHAGVRDRGTLPLQQNGLSLSPIDGLALQYPEA